jgi:hypothetical protein
MADLWSDARRRLIGKKELFPGLGCFDPDKHNNPDDVVNKALINITAPNPYDAYQIESLLSSTSALLDRCISYRREMYDLENSGLKLALDYELFLDQYVEPTDAGAVIGGPAPAQHSVRFGKASSDGRVGAPHRAPPAGQPPICSDAQ